MATKKEYAQGSNGVRYCTDTNRPITAAGCSELGGLFILLAIVLAVAGCSRIANWLEESQERNFEWTEDVLLHSGEKVVVRRTARLSGNNIAGGGGGSFNKGMKLDIVTGIGVSPITWGGLYVPILLDRDATSGDWVLVATFFHCDSWYKLNRPILPYTQYRFNNGGWVQENLSPNFFGRKANLFIADRLPPVKHLNLQAKLDAIPNTAGKEYKFIVSEWSTGC